MREYGDRKRSEAHFGWCKDEVHCECLVMQATIWMEDGFVHGNVMDKRLLILLDI